MSGDFAFWTHKTHPRLWVAAAPNGPVAYSASRIFLISSAPQPWGSDATTLSPSNQSVAQAAWPPVAQAQQPAALVV